MIESPGDRMAEMMRDNANTDIVRGIYRNFLAGDIAAVLNAFDPDIDWNSRVNRPGARTPLAYEGPCRGREAVARCFELFNTAVRYEATMVSARFYTSGERVLAVGHDIRRDLVTGGLTENRWSMLWRFRDGRAAHIRIYQDTIDILD